MKATELGGMRVVDVQSARELGTVHDVLLDPQQSRVTALLLRRGIHGGGQVVPNEAIRAIGRDAVTVDGASIPPAETEAQSGALRLSRLQGIKVLSEDGTQLGTLQDAQFDPETREITGYVYSHGGFAGLMAEQRLLPRDQVRRAGAELVIVAREAIGQAPSEREQTGR